MFLSGAVEMEAQKATQKIVSDLGAEIRGCR
jgi:hypothetical protein